MKYLILLVALFVCVIGCEPKAKACDGCVAAFAVPSVSAVAVAQPAFVQSFVAVPQVTTVAVAAPVFQSVAVAAPSCHFGAQAVAFGGCGRAVVRSRSVAVARSGGFFFPRRSVSRSRAVSVTRGF